MIPDIVWASRVELASRMSSSVSVDFVIGRLHISQILQIALIHIILLDSCQYFLGFEGVEWSSRVSSSDQGLRKGKPSLRLQSGAIQQRPNALQCMGGGTAKWELIIGDSSTSHPPSV